VTREQFLTAYAEAHRIRRERDALMVMSGQASRRPILVGEDNPYSARPSDALLPYPVKSAGYRLATTILGLSVVEYLTDFDRVNLCGTKWDDEVARKRWRLLLDGGNRTLILLGEKVCRAAGNRDEHREAAHAAESKSPLASTMRAVRPIEFFTKGMVSYLNTIVTLPHPSGRSRVWNDPTAIPRARALVLPLIGRAP